MVMASDGYPRVMLDLESSEKELKRIISEDPLLFRLHRSFRPVGEGKVSYDDRAHLKFIA